MMKAPLSLARKDVLELTPYSSARSLNLEADILLDANECPWPPCPGDDRALGLNRYPDPQPRALLSALSALYGVPEESLFLGRGTDDAIDALVRTFCQAGENDILVCPPTYGVYGVAARIQGAGVRAVPLTKEPAFQPDVPAILRAWDPRLRLVFFCSPNNPTGNAMDADSVVEVCEAFREKAVVVLDEAYAEFSSKPSLITRLEGLPNLVILRTLSKAWALAGARCGAALGDPRIMGLLHKVRAPYPLSLPSVRAALRALSPQGKRLCSGRVKRLRSERERLAGALSALPGVEKVYPSDANFLLARVKDAGEVFERCKSHGILVRDRGSEPGLSRCVRITVGRPEENDRLLDALERED
ncbi:MAG: histidinol-phosphate transaminase [Elusimicrobiota bacterium]